MANLKRISKAIAAGVGGLVGAYGTAFADGAITNQEWFGIVGAAILAAAVTYFAPKNAENSELVLPR
jgi:type 1 glutamine amidotransferase